MKHTPGPWEWDKKTEEILAHNVVVVWELGTNDADSKLISKAPDMYEALTELLRDWTFQMSLYEETANAKAVRELLEEIDGTK